MRSRFARCAQRSRGKNGSVKILRSGRVLFAIGALGFVMAAVAPASAGEPARCNWLQADALGAQADRYRARGQFDSAAQSYIAAARSAQDCPVATGLMLTARSLAPGGTVSVRSGVAIDGRWVAASAQSRLQSIFAVDAQTATASRSYFDMIQNVVSAIGRIAQLYM
jgi:hypothetical protein